jgi:YegS/Rv2252/BmrU family lipid kinase
VDVTLICNPQSGRGVDADGTADRIRRLGAEIVELADSPEEARAEGAERLVVVGGDGTIAPAAALAARRGIPLAIVAGGTANDFARAVGLPLEMDAAIDLAVLGTTTRPLELARMGDRPFVNAASSGLSPAAARRAEPFKARLGPLAYPLGAVLAGLREHPVACRVVADGRTVYDGRAWQVTVAATGAFGGGAEIEAADPSDGLLDLVLVPDGPRLGLPQRALGMRTGRLADQDGVTHVRADELEVTLPDGTPFNVDGEVVGGGGRTTFGAERDAFAVVVA